MKHNHIKLLGVLTVLLFVAAAQAGLFLPASDIWQGSRDNVKVGSTGATAYIEYAVYASASLPDAIDIETTDKYVYAYKIWYNNSAGADYMPIASLILSGGTTSVVNNIGSLTDGTTTGISPDYAGIDTANSTCVWEFQNGLLVQSKHSIFLVFTSNFAPKAGTIKLSTEYGADAPVTGDDTVTGDSTSQIPEPTTIALLSLGAFAFRKVRRS
jgi:hypothetical protein